MASSLKISKRENVGSRESRKLRYEGLVPGIIYGGKTEPTLIAIEEKELKRECASAAFYGHVIEANVGSAAEKFIPKRVDFHPVSGNPIHVDFLRISKDSKVKVSVPLEITGEEKSPGIKKGGVINVIVRKLECRCLLNAIPEKILVNLAGREIGDSIMLGDLKLPDGVTPVHSDRDAVIATIVGARAEEEETVVAEAATEAPSEESKDKK